MFGKIGKILRNGCYETPTAYDWDVQDLKFVNKSDNKSPVFAKTGDSGFDLRAWITPENDSDAKYNKDEDKYQITLKSLERKMIHTGLYFMLPECTEIQVRPRSGLTLKKGLSVLNTPGTVDEKYVGEVCVILVNLSKEKITITSGERIAQAILMPVYNSNLVNLIQIDEVIENTERGSDGFGSSGVK